MNHYWETFRSMINRVYETYFPNRIISVINYDYGHLRSKNEKRSINAKGDPIPWFTYPAIEYLSQLNLKNRTVFEWGCGASTEYFSKCCKKVYSIESNSKWYEKIKDLHLYNLEIRYASGNAYIHGINQYKRKFDIIVIDGILRKECVKIAPKYIKNDGMIILDNSERHANECKFFRSKGFIQVDFIGFGPIADISWVTSMFLTRKFTIKPLFTQPIVPIGNG